MTDTSQRDYRFDSWQEITPLPSGWMNGIKSVPIRSVATIYDANISRMIKLPHVILRTFVEGGFYGQYWLAAYHKVFGIDATASAPEEQDEDRWHEHHRILGELQKGASTEFGPPLPLGFDWTNHKPFTSIQNALGEQIEMMMFAQITFLWTAIETMAGDLWETAVNVCPDRLTKDNATISIKHIRQATRRSLDLNGLIGTALKMKTSFQKLSDIRDAFRLIFSDHGEDINNALSDHSLDALGAARNVIVHKNAVMDLEYAEQYRQAPALLPNPERGKSFPIDGLFLLRLVPSVQDCGVRLIKAVDNWLARHVKIPNGENRGDNPET